MGAGPLLDASARALAAFEAANDRSATTLERELLADLERDFAADAQRSATTSSAWIADAIKEAVNSGSRFVAPKRIREILIRWANAAGDPVRQSGARSAQPLATHTTGAGNAGNTKSRGRRQPAQEPITSHTVPLGGEGGPETAAQVGSIERPLPAPRFSVAPGLSSAQVWAAAQADLAERLTSANFETWIRPAALIGRESDGRLVIGVPSKFAQSRVAARLREPVEEALAVILGVPVEVSIVVTQEWLRRQGTSATSTEDREGEGERASD